jgi:hypothetical protein
MRRFHIGGLMALVLYVALGLAALLTRVPTIFWASAVYSLTAAVMASSVLLALPRSGLDRMRRTGFAIFGWTYLLLAFGETATGYPLLTRFVISELHQYWRDITRDPILDLRPSLIIGHSVLAVLCGLVGAALGQSLAVRDEGRAA